MSTQHSEHPVDSKQLQAQGGPVTYNKQIGYGTFYLNVTTLVFGDNYDQVKLTFTNSAGAFSPPTFLSPQNPSAVPPPQNSGLMTLTFEQIQLYPPTPDTPGSVTVNAHWTDNNGNGKNSNNGTVSSWTNPPSDSK